MSAHDHANITPAPNDNAGATGWFIEYSTPEDNSIRRIAIRPLPFQIGRDPGLALSLDFGHISRLHAEVFMQNGNLMIRDLGSTNGTHINQNAVEEPLALKHGDILNLVGYEYRFVYEPPRTMEELRQTQAYGKTVRKGKLSAIQELREMIKTRNVLPVFQPIARLHDSTLFGYELLGRGGFGGIASTPKDLFAIASGAGLESKLSRVFLIVGVEASRQLPELSTLFVNAHPADLVDTKGLIEALKEARDINPSLTFYLEINEAAATNSQYMRDLKSALKDLEIGLVYDDFGAGQTRLLELVEAPPSFLKFDMSLIQGIHDAGPQRQQMVEMLVKFANDAGVRTVAEGVESLKDAAACKQLGFFCAQGYHFGRPLPVGIYGEDTKEYTMAK